MSAPAPAPVERIAVFRALVLGDLLCATPALRALRRRHPQARITLVGLPWARALVQRMPSLDDFVEFPGHPGLPERACDVRALPGFLADLQAQRFDLALQLHGSGGIVNPLVASFGARRTAGFCGPGAWRPEDDAAGWIAWPTEGHEIERLLTLTDHLGCPRDGVHLDFPVTDADRAGLAAQWPGGRRPARYAVVHAGAQLPSRRWGVERFARVADQLAARGLTIVLSGTADEAPLVAELAARMAAPAIVLAGRTSLWTLGALLEGAALLVCNDTGLSHVAAALRCPSVVVSCGAEVARWAPLELRRHVVLAHEVECRPCAYRDCPVGHACAQGVAPEQVLEAAAARLAA